MNINFLLEENGVINESSTELDTFMKEFEFHQTNEIYSNDTILHETNEIYSNDNIFAQMKNYDTNFNLKQLVLICEYYKLKPNKLKKQEVIEQIILFENEYENISTVIKRKELWYYLNELKNDKMMKKFIIW
jgi:hypothetical protein